MSHLASAQSSSTPSSPSYPNSQTPESSFSSPSYSPMHVPSPSSPAPSIPPRRSGRLTTMPSYLHDYVCNSIVLTDLTGDCFLHPFKPTSFSFNSLYFPNQHTLLSISHITEPHSFAQASTHPGWTTVVQEELSALDFNHTWEIVELPPGKRVLPCKWVYKVKHKSDGTVEMLKARLVVRGDI